VTDLAKRDGHDAAREAISAVFAALLAGGTGPLAPFVAAAITPLTRRMVELIAAEWSRKSDVVADSALEYSGFDDPEDFCDALAEDPALIALAQKILLAASLSGNDRKLRALGSLLGDAVATHRLDENGLLVDALAAFEDSHARVLDVLAGVAPDDDETRRAAAAAAAPMAVTDPSRWLLAHVEAKVPIASEFVLACLNALTRHGLARQLYGYGGLSRFEITDFGCVLLETMGNVAARAQPAED
jgi:hypothetical protein